MRSHNDGFQIWNGDRRKFGLCKVTGKKMLLTEEGLATINAHLALSCHLLWKPALLYCEWKLMVCYPNQATTTEGCNTAHEYNFS